MSANKQVIIDANVVIHGRGDLPYSKMLIPQKVYEEVKSDLSKLKLDSLGLNVLIPGKDVLDIVEEKKREINADVSEPDCSVAALGLERSAKVITDDKELQNLCWHLGVDFDSFLGEKISKKREFKILCDNCGYSLESMEDVCSRCGSTEANRKPI